MTQNYPNIPKEKLRLANNISVHDQKIDSKPLSYFKDAMIRFAKNKSSLVAAIIIIIMVLFAVIAPFFSNYSVSFRDGYYAKALPSLKIARDNGWGFWDGASMLTGGQSAFDSYAAIDYEANFVSEETERFPALISYTVSEDSAGTKSYSMYIDSYQKVGYVYLNLTEEEYLNLQSYQNETNIQVIYPLQNNYQAVGANYWYKLEEPYQTKATEAHSEKHSYADIGKATALLDEDGNYVPDYMTSTNINAYNYNSIRLDFSGTPYEEGTQKEMSSPVNESSETSYPVLYDSEGNRYVWYSDKVGYAVWVDGIYQKAYTDGAVSANSDWYADKDMSEKLTSASYYYVYGYKNQTGYKVRVNYYEYFKYVNGFYPNFLFGTNVYGQDIFVCLASGARLSFILAICVCAVNFFIGAIYGAIEGYFGGATDMVMERISDILASVPFIVVATLFQLHLAQKLGAVASLIFAFVLTGWIGMASTVRMQVYRYKGQEYVLAARTLGAKDWRIIWKHIFPNCLGTIITGSVLAIPGVIFSESMLSYLGIVNLETGSLTSIGTMLSQGSGMLRSYPHIIAFPAVFIALLEISFNLFGNGLRDAFNPSLRGTEG